jgi:hypothetical protein
MYRLMYASNVTAGNFRGSGRINRFGQTPESRFSFLNLFHNRHVTERT